jgi:hypothetical protein
MSHLRAGFRRHPVLSTLFVLALLAALVFAARTARDAMGWDQRFAHAPEVAGWMTPRYVARSWHVPPEVVQDALGLDPGDGRRTTIAELAAERGQPAATLADALERDLSAWIEAQP